MSLTLGDPGGMRWKASDLRARAADVRTRIEWVRKQAASLRFDGPGGDRFRQRIAQWEGESESIANEMDDIAHYLVREAHVLDEIHRAEQKLVGH